MVMGLDYVLDPHAHVAGHREVVLDVELGVDDRRDTGVLVSHKVGPTAEVVVDELAEDHRVDPAGSSASSSDTWRRRSPQTCLAEGEHRVVGDRITRRGALLGAGHDAGLQQHAEML